MHGYFYYVKCLLKTGQKSYSFSDHYKQHSKYTTSRTGLHLCMNFKVVKKINIIEVMKKIKNLTVVYVWNNG